MKTSLIQVPGKKSHTPDSDIISRKLSTHEFNRPFTDNRSEAVTQRKFKEMANNGATAKSSLQLKTLLNKPAQKQEVEEEEMLQGKFTTTQLKEQEEEELLQGKFEPIQKKGNNTGLPNNLKSGIESLSGVGMDDVQVHYNSDKPAQLNAHAYAQGTDIHVSSGQEKHLPHEAWHVVQQKQGRVNPTMQLKDNINVNDDAGLEKEADVMGAKALEKSNKTTSYQKKNQSNLNNKTYQRFSVNSNSWDKTKKAWFSSGSGEGVLFIKDKGPAVVVKSAFGFEAEIIIASNLINESTKGNDGQNNGWKINTPNVRTANQQESNDIVNNAKHVLGNTIDNKSQAILDNISDPNSATLIMSMVKGKEAMKLIGDLQSAKKTTVKHTKNHKIGERTERDTFVTRLYKESGPMKLLGKTAAIDIFMGNKDRIIGGVINTKNFMADMNDRAIRLIDNVEAGQFFRTYSNNGFTQTAKQSFDFWTTHVDSLAKDEYDEISISVVDNIIDEIKNQLRDEDKAIINKNLQDNSAKMKNWFSEGLQHGHTILKKSLSDPNKLVNGVPREFRKDALKNIVARKNVIAYGLDKDTAWENANLLVDALYDSRKGKI